MPITRDICTCGDPFDGFDDNCPLHGFAITPPGKRIELIDGYSSYEQAMAQIQAWAQHDYIHTTDEFIALVELAMKKKPDASRSRTHAP